MISEEAKSLEDAIGILRRRGREGIDCALGERWRLRAIEALEDRFDRYLRDGAIVVRTREELQAALRVAAAEVLTAGQALEQAAARLNKRGDSVGASTAHRAALNLRELAASLGGG